MDKELFISVIIPVYNVENYLKECIESVLNQTYKNYELILVDDGSTDRSGKICDEYAKIFSNIKVIHQDNQGQSAARNVGVKNAKADWILFIDSDDVAHPRLAEYFVRAAEETSCRICACDRVESVLIPKDFFDDKEFLLKSVDINESSLIELIKTNYFWALFPSLIRKDVYLKHEMPLGRIYEDNAVCPRWLYEAKRLAIIDSELYFYRQTPNSTMHKALTHKSADYLWALEEQIKFAKEVGYSRLLELIYENYMQTAIDMARRYIKENEDYQFAKQILIYAKNIDKKYSLKVSSKEATEYKRDIKFLLHPALKLIRKKFIHFISLFKKK